MKKLKFYICFAAVLLIATHFAAAQTFGKDPVSELKNSSLRFTTDVDLYFGVNDWADVGVTKWFSFLIWEGGLALQLSKVYLATYYNGTFNRGVESQGTETIDLVSGETNKGFPLTAGFPAAGQTGTIKRNNYFGVLAGIGKHGFKFTLKDTLTTTDVPVYTTGVYTDPNAGTDPNPEKAAKDAIGKYLYRKGDITPALQWGASEDMSFGKYVTRPSIGLALAKYLI